MHRLQDEDDPQQVCNWHEGSSLCLTLRFGPTIATLAYSQRVEVTDSPPAGCAIVTVSEKVRHPLNYSLLTYHLFSPDPSPPDWLTLPPDPLQVSAHLLLKGLIDPVKEVEKLEKRRSALLVSIDKLRKAAEVKGDFPGLAYHNVLSSN